MGKSLIVYNRLNKQIKWLMDFRKENPELSGIKRYSVNDMVNELLKIRDGYY